MTALQRECGPEPRPYGEGPLEPAEALAFALAAARGRRMWSGVDMADAALALVDMREVGWDVAAGLSGLSASERAGVLAGVLARGQRHDVSPRDRSDAEAAVGWLATLGFDLTRRRPA